MENLEKEIERLNLELSYMVEKNKEKDEIIESLAKEIIELRKASFDILEQTKKAIEILQKK